MELTMEQFALRAPKLRAYSASRRGTKQERKERERNRCDLVADKQERNGEWLAKFTMHTLSALPTAGAAGADAIPRLECAQEAAGLLLTLAAYASPQSEQLCYNVALRCHALVGPLTRCWI